jgi:MFS family permease
VQIVSSEVFPLWVVTSKQDGGFGFSSDSIGTVIMISGVFTVLTQLLVYPALVSSMGCVKVYRLGCHMFASVVIGMPLISLMNGDTTTPDDMPPDMVTWILVVTALTLMGCGIMFTLISVFVLINNSCYSHERATVNGIGQTFAALGRLIGPYLGSTLFAWSENNGQAWPFNYFFVWYILGIISFANARVSYFLPRSIERRRREPREPRYAALATGFVHEEMEDDNDSNMGDDEEDDDFLETDDLIAGAEEVDTVADVESPTAGASGNTGTVAAIAMGDKAAADGDIELGPMNGTTTK